MHRDKTLVKTATLAYIGGLLVMPCSGAAQRPWYRAERMLDLTGDGRPEVVAVRALGVKPESLAVELTITSDRDVLYRVEWNSILYFFYDQPIDEIADSVIRGRVTEQLERLLEDSAFERFSTADYPASWVPTAPDSDDPRNMIGWALKRDEARQRLTDSLQSEPTSVQLARYTWAFPVDTAAVNRVWEDMAGLDLVAFTFFSGGEHLRKIVWSPLRREFMVVWSCC